MAQPPDEGPGEPEAEVTAIDAVESIQAALIAGDDAPHPFIKHTEERAPVAGETIVIALSHVAHRRGPDCPDPRYSEPLNDYLNMTRSAHGQTYEVLEVRQGRIAHDELSKTRLKGKAPSVRVVCKADVNFARVAGRVDTAWVTIWEKYVRVNRFGELYDIGKVHWISHAIADSDLFADPNILWL